MPLQFNMKRDPSAGLVPEGVHRFVVEAAQEKNGDKGPYISLSIKAYPNGVKHNSLVFESLSGSEGARFKVDQFFDAVGAPVEGQAGEAWFKGRSGWARFKHIVNRDGDTVAVVARYLTDDQAEKAIAKEEAAGGGFDPMGSPAAPKAAADPVRKTSGKKAAVAEMDNDASPF